MWCECLGKWWWQTSGRCKYEAGEKARDGRSKRVVLQKRRRTCRSLLVSYHGVWLDLPNNPTRLFRHTIIYSHWYQISFISLSQAIDISVRFLSLFLGFCNLTSSITQYQSHICTIHFDVHHVVSLLAIRYSFQVNRCNWFRKCSNTSVRSLQPNKLAYVVAHKEFHWCYILVLEAPQLRILQNQIFSVKWSLNDPSVFFAHIGEN